MGMSEDPNEKELPEDEEVSSDEEEATEAASEVTEIELEPVGEDEGPGDETVGGDSVALGQGKLAEKDEKLFGGLAHFLGTVSSFIGPLVIWLIKKDESPFVDDQGKESLNFQITLFIGYVISGVLSLACIGYLLMPALMVVNLVFCILAGIAANDGKTYRYPFALRLIK